MTHVFASGVKNVFELRLASGRSVVASANHPFLTVGGWAQLGQLKAGMFVGSSRHAGPIDPRVDMVPREVWDYIESKGMLVEGSMRAQHLMQQPGGAWGR